MGQMIIRAGSGISSRKHSDHSVTDRLKNDTIRFHICALLIAFFALAAMICVFSAPVHAVTVEFNPASYTVNENAGTVTLTVTGTNAASHADMATVGWTTANGGAIAGTNFGTSGSTQQVTNGILPIGLGWVVPFITNVQSQTFTIPILNDGKYNRPLSFTVTLNGLSVSQDSYGTNRIATVTINNVNPAPTVQFAATSYTLNENAGTATITVTKTGSTAISASVNYATSGGDATSASYDPTSGTLTFAAGETSKTFTVPLHDDGLYDTQRYFNVVLSSPVNATLGTPSSVPVYINNVDPAPVVQLSASSYDVNENAGTVTITATRTNDAAGAVTVDYATSDGTAISGTNYQSASGTLTFNPGVMSQTITVTILDDNLYDPNTQFSLALSNPTGDATIGTQDTATVTVNNVDPAPVIQFDPATYSVNENGGTVTITATRTNDAVDPVTVDYATSDGTAIAGTNYQSTSGTLTFNKGELSKTFDVSVTDDGLYGPNTQFTATLSNPTGGATIGTADTATVTVNNVDPAPVIQFDPATYNVDENAGSVTITATRTNDAVDPVTVDYTTNDGTAKDGTNYVATSGTLTFNQGELSKTFDVSVTDDGLYGPDTQFTATLSNPTGDATIGTADTATVTVNNVDPAPVIQVDPATYDVNENAGTVTITVTRANDAVDPVTVDYTTNDGTAKAGTNYVGTSGTLTFNKGEFSKTFDVSVTDDGLYGPDTQFTATISNPTGDAMIGTQDTATVTVNNVDPAPVIQFDPATYNVDENAGSATITANRTNDAVDPVTVDYMTNDGTAISGTNYQGTSGTLTFNPGVMSQTITVMILDDNLYGPNTQFTATLSNPTGGATIGTQDTATVTVNNVDAAPVIQFDPATYSVNENGGSVTITANRTNDAVGMVTVDYATSDGTAIAGTNYVGTSGTLTFNKGEFTKTFDVTVIDDNTYGPDTQFTATLSNPTGDATIGTTDTATVTVNNVDSMPAITVDAPTSIDENSHATITFHKTGNTKIDATFDVTVTDTAGSGLASVTPASVSFGPADYTKTIDLYVASDGVYGATRSITLSFNNANNCTLPDPQVITVNDTDRRMYVINLVTGWNLVSFPVVNTTLKASDLTGIGVQTVASYNLTTGDYDSYIIGVSPSQYDITMSTDVGYFVYCTKDTSIVVYGMNPSDRSITINPGWNLIGWSSFTSSTAKAVSAEQSLSGAQTIARYNMTTGDYDSYIEGISPDSYDFSMHDGVGYFVYTGSATPQTLHFEVI